MMSNGSRRGLASRHSLGWIAAAAVGLVGMHSSVAQGEITSSVGSVTVIPAPPDARAHQLESNTTIHVWEERQNVVLTAGLPVNIDGTPGTYDAPSSPPLTGGFIPAGTEVDSHLIHMDNVSGGHWMTGDVEFADEIIGVMLLCDELDGSDALCGAPGTLLSKCSTTGGRRTCDWDAGFDEFVTISADRKHFRFTLYTSNLMDEIRVITRPGDPDPGLGDCVEFENFSPGAPWPCCDVPFTSEGKLFRTKAFRWFNGVVTNGGEAYPVERCCNEDHPPGLGTNNIMVAPNISDFVGTNGARKITFCYENCGGNVNLRINGQWEFAWNDFHTMPNALFAGVGVLINAPPPAFVDGCWRGYVELTTIGTDDCIETFAVGGQEFCIDSLCIDEPCIDEPGDMECIEFNNFGAGAPWPCCDIAFIVDGYIMGTRVFKWFDGTEFMGGEAYPVSQCCDQDHSAGLGMNNVQIDIPLDQFFGSDGVREITFCYQNCGGNVNLTVNNQWEYAWNDFHTMPGNLFAGEGVQIIAPPPAFVNGCWQGSVTLRAMGDDDCITEFRVGGQEFCIDNFCVEGPCEEAETCRGDIDGNGVVDTNDLLILLANWGACPQPCPPLCPGDITGDCTVDTNDLLALLAAWGPCP